MTTHIVKYSKIVQSLGFAALITLNSCGEKNTHSHMSVVGGTPTSGFPAVVQIAREKVTETLEIIGGVQYQKKVTTTSNCTATWVSSNTLISAAHCFEPKAGEQEFAQQVFISAGIGATRTIQSKSVEIFPKYQAGIPDHDLAVVIFEKDHIDPKFAAKISDKEPHVNSDVTIVGYGKFDHFDETSGGKKRFGCNLLAKITDRLDFCGRTRSENREDGTEALNSQGDSGGPMFLGKIKDDKQELSELIGVASTVQAHNAGEIPTKLHGHYIDLLRGEYLTWLSETTKRGAKINGLEKALVAFKGRNPQADPRDVLVLDDKDKPLDTPKTPNIPAKPAPAANGLVKIKGPTGVECECGVSNGQCAVLKSSQLLASTPLTADDANCQNSCHETNGVLARYCQ